MFRSLLPGTLVLLLASLSGVQAADDSSAEASWPQWRGPRRDNLSRDTGLLTKWPADGPPLVWEAKGAGTGYASISLVDGRAYTLGDGPSSGSDPSEYITCWSAADGKPLWKRRVGAPWTSGPPDWQSARSTPTVAGGRVYVLSPHGDLACFDAAGGKPQWHKSLTKDFGGKKGDGWGYSESVLVDGDHLVCTPGGPQATLVALDARSGKLIWKAVVPSDRGAGHSSIVISEVGGTKVYVQTTSSNVLGVRAKDGKVLWTHPIGATAVIPTPIIRDDLVFADAGYGKGGTLLRQVPSSGGVKAEEVYPYKQPLGNKHGGIILVDDHLYGDTDDQGRPYCAELMTGDIRWKKERGAGGGSASLTYADGHLYILYADGTMVLAQASPKAYEQVSAFKVPHKSDRPAWAHPVVAGGKLFLREGDHLFCYDLHAK